ncbi:retroviral-like aspartic protease family protein [Candidatus Magnetobacterium casense]|uniref:Aspartyl protease family protein n=1 Tax=Candidatus Magnetobacterium casense TaxID=1455061 RepID=A0ABS6RV73_9BACT|nr:retroviral-like aspartic protease family protein [Candidatus Magnetobacterium casensis]MBV6340534.1 aspartyl protease family protein [Candidatus Magnetobacterium casensis]
MYDLDCNNETLMAIFGICLPYDSDSDRPIIDISIKNDDDDDSWTTEPFLLDTGADVSIINSQKARRIGLNPNIYTGTTTIGGITGGGKFRLREVRARINGVELTFTLAFGPKMIHGINILSYRAVLSAFLLAFEYDRIALFPR